MKLEDAINLLDQICSQVNVNREMHDKIKEAVETLWNEHKKKKEEE